MAGLIRSDEAPTRPAFSFEDLEREAAATRRRAQIEARRVLETANEQALRLREKYKHEGYQAGLEEGRRTGREQAVAEARDTLSTEVRDKTDKLRQALQAGLQQLERDKRRLLAAAESGLIALALSVARRVCKIEVGRNTESARANARRLLEMVAHQGDVTLRVDPAEAAVLRETLGEFSECVDRLEHVAIVEDETVGRGGCVVTTRAGSVDASVELQLDRIAQAILGESDGPSDSDSG